MGRKDVAEHHLGGLLARVARSQTWDDWLPEYVLNHLERSANAGLRAYFNLGVRNARGMTSRNPYESGAQERSLAGHYRELAARYGNLHPRVSSMLTSIAADYQEDARRQDQRATVGERWQF